MPKSRVRRKSAYTPPPRRSPDKQRSAPWVGALMLGLFLLGVVWLVVYYVSSSDIPGLRTLGPWNLAIGFVLIMSGFLVAVRWR